MRTFSGCHPRMAKMAFGDGGLFLILLILSFNLIAQTPVTLEAGIGITTPFILASTSGRGNLGMLSSADTTVGIIPLLSGGDDVYWLDPDGSGGEKAVFQYSTDSLVWSAFDTDSLWSRPKGGCIPMDSLKGDGLTGYFPTSLLSAAPDTLKVYFRVLVVHDDGDTIYILDEKGHTYDPDPPVEAMISIPRVTRTFLGNLNIELDMKAGMSATVTNRNICPLITKAIPPTGITNSDYCLSGPLSARSLVRYLSNTGDTALASGLSDEQLLDSLEYYMQQNDSSVSAGFLDVYKGLFLWLKKGNNDYTMDFWSRNYKGTMEFWVKLREEMAMKGSAAISLFNWTGPGGDTLGVYLPITGMGNYLMATDADETELQYIRPGETEVLLHIADGSVDTALSMSAGAFILPGNAWLEALLFITPGQDGNQGAGGTGQESLVPGLCDPATSPAITLPVTGGTFVLGLPVHGLYSLKIIITNQYGHEYEFNRLIEYNNGEVRIPFAFGNESREVEPRDAFFINEGADWIIVNLNYTYFDTASSLTIRPLMEEDSLFGENFEYRLVSKIPVSMADPTNLSFNGTGVDGSFKFTFKADTVNWNQFYTDTSYREPGSSCILPSPDSLADGISACLTFPLPDILLSNGQGIDFRITATNLTGDTLVYDNCNNVFYDASPPLPIDLNIPEYLNIFGDTLQVSLTYADNTNYKILTKKTDEIKNTGIPGITAIPYSTCNSGLLSVASVITYLENLGDSTIGAGLAGTGLLDSLMHYYQRKRGAVYNYAGGQPKKGNGILNPGIYGDTAFGEFYTLASVLGSWIREHSSDSNLAVTSHLFMRPGPQGQAAPVYDSTYYYELRNHINRDDPVIWYEWDFDFGGLFDVVKSMSNKIYHVSNGGDGTSGYEWLLDGVYDRDAASPAQFTRIDGTTGRFIYPLMPGDTIQPPVRCLRGFVAVGHRIEIAGGEMKGDHEEGGPGEYPSQIQADTSIHLEENGMYFLRIITQNDLGNQIETDRIIIHYDSLVRAGNIIGGAWCHYQPQKRYLPPLDTIPVLLPLLPDAIWVYPDPVLDVARYDFQWSIDSLNWMTYYIDSSSSLEGSTCGGPCKKPIGQPCDGISGYFPASLLAAQSDTIRVFFRTIASSEGGSAVLIADTGYHIWDPMAPADSMINIPYGLSITNDTVRFSPGPANLIHYNIQLRDVCPLVERNLPLLQTGMGDHCLSGPRAGLLATRYYRDSDSDTLLGAGLSDEAILDSLKRFMAWNDSSGTHLIALIEGLREWLRKGELHYNLRLTDLWDWDCPVSLNTGENMNNGAFLISLYSYIDENGDTSGIYLPCNAFSNYLIRTVNDGKKLMYLEYDEMQTWVDLETRKVDTCISLLSNGFTLPSGADFIAGIVISTDEDIIPVIQPDNSGFSGTPGDCGQNPGISLQGLSGPVAIPLGPYGLFFIRVQAWNQYGDTNEFYRLVERAIPTVKMPFAIGNDAKDKLGDTAFLHLIAERFDTRICYPFGSVMGNEVAHRFDSQLDFQVSHVFDPQLDFHLSYPYEGSIEYNVSHHFGSQLDFQLSHDFGCQVVMECSYFFDYSTDSLTWTQIYIDSLSVRTAREASSGMSSGERNGGVNAFFYPGIIDTSGIGDECLPLFFRIRTMLPGNDSILIYSNNRILCSPVPIELIALNNIPEYKKFTGDTLDLTVTSAVVCDWQFALRPVQEHTMMDIPPLVTGKNAVEYTGPVALAKLIKQTAALGDNMLTAGLGDEALVDSLAAVIQEWPDDGLKDSVIAEWNDLVYGLYFWLNRYGSAGTYDIESESFYSSDSSGGFSYSWDTADYFTLRNQLNRGRPTIILLSYIENDDTICLALPVKGISNILHPVYDSTEEAEGLTRYEWDLGIDWTSEDDSISTVDGLLLCFDLGTGKAIKLLNPGNPAALQVFNGAGIIAYLSVVNPIDLDFDTSKKGPGIKCSSGPSSDTITLHAAVPDYGYYFLRVKATDQRNNVCEIDRVVKRKDKYVPSAYYDCDSFFELWSMKNRPTPGQPPFLSPINDTISIKILEHPGFLLNSKDTLWPLYKATNWRDAEDKVVSVAFQWSPDSVNWTVFDVDSSIQGVGAFCHADGLDDDCDGIRGDLPVMSLNSLPGFTPVYLQAMMTTADEDIVFLTLQYNPYSFDQYPPHKIIFNLPDQSSLAHDTVVITFNPGQASLDSVKIRLESICETQAMDIPGIGNELMTPCQSGPNAIASILRFLEQNNPGICSGLTNQQLISRLQSLLLDDDSTGTGLEIMMKGKVKWFSDHNAPYRAGISMYYRTGPSGVSRYSWDSTSWQGIRNEFLKGNPVILLFNWVTPGGDTTGYYGPLVKARTTVQAGDGSSTARCLLRINTGPGAFLDVVLDNATGHVVECTNPDPGVPSVLPQGAWLAGGIFTMPAIDTTSFTSMQITGIAPGPSVQFTLPGTGRYFLRMKLKNDLGNDVEFDRVIDRDLGMSCPPSDTIIMPSGPVPLGGGLPEGGFFCGPGVIDSLFYPDSAGLGVHTISYFAGDTACRAYHCQFTLTVKGDIPGITGTVNYDNNLLTPLSSVKVFLKQGDQTVDSTTSGADGHYEFDSLGPGNYTVACIHDGEWGGVNSIDALLILKHFVELIQLQGLRYKAADVNASGNVNSIDALDVMKRFVGLISAFDIPDWLFEKPVVEVLPYTISEINIKGLCAGDVDGSYIP